MTNRKTTTLPPGWIWTTFGDITKITTGNPAPQGKEFFDNGEYPFVRVKDMGKLNTIYLDDAEDHINKKASEKLKLFPKGSVVFTKSGMSILLNQKGILDKDMYVVSHIGVAIPEDEITSEWLYFWLKTIDFKNLIHATTLPSLKLSKITKLPILLAPYEEQIRIRKKTKDIFSQVNSIINASQTIKENLELYEKSIPLNVFNGKLTKSWRSKNKKILESSKDDFEQLMAVTRSWSKIKKLPPLDFTNLPKLSSGWKWCRLGDLCKRIQYGTSEKATRDSSGIPILGMQNIINGKLSFNSLKYMSQNWPKLNDFLLKDGDVLFNRTNSAELVGKTAVYKKTHPKAIFASYLIRIELYTDYLESDILEYYINSLHGRHYINSVQTQQVGQANVNGTKLAMMPIPFIPKPEQLRILQFLEKDEELISHIENVINANFELDTNFKQSTIKKLFEGKLVKQNPKDIHAQQILEKIKKSRLQN